MFELRKLIPADILEIKDNLVEGQNIGNLITPEMADKAAAIGRAFTYVKDSKVVACIGEINTEPDIVDIWALYSDKASCISRARATIEFKKLLKFVEGKGRLFVSEETKNGRRYAEFCGFRLTGKKSKVLDVNYDEYLWNLT